jgi:chromosome segregation ATPase
VEGLLREINELKKETLNGSAINAEKDRLLNEVTKLNEEIDKMFEDLQAKGRKEVSLKEKLDKVEDTLHQQESENTQLKLERMESQNKLSVLERQTDDLKNDLSTMRRRKVELDEENCNLKKDKSSVDGKLAVLQTTNDGLVQELQKAKQKISQLEEEITALKLEKLELQQQVRLAKMQEANYQDVVQRFRAVTDSDTSGSNLTSADESAEKDHTRRTKKKSSLEKQISKLKREKAEYELRVERLKQDVESLEREALKQIEQNKAVSAEFVSAKKDSEKRMDDLQRQKEALNASIVEVQHKEEGEHS